MAARAAATQTPVWRGSTPSLESIHPAHVMPPSASSDATDAVTVDRDRPTATTVSPTASPNSGPAMYGNVPVNSYSPRISAPSAATSAPHTSPPTVLTTAGNLPAPRPGSSTTLRPLGISLVCGRMATGSPSDDRAPAPSDALARTDVDTSDWPAQVAETIERIVGQVRDMTTGRAITAARALVYGTFALLVGVAVAVLLAISAVRLLDAYLPDSVVGEEHTWVAHLIVGGVLTIAGMVLWSRRSARTAADGD